MGTLLLHLQELLRDRQHARILRLAFPHNDGPASTLLVNKLDANEGLTVELLSSNATIDLKTLQGKPCSDSTVRRPQRLPLPHHGRQIDLPRAPRMLQVLLDRIDAGQPVVSEAAHAICPVAPVRLGQV